MLVRAFVTMLLACAVAPIADAQQNVLVIVADDLGVRNIGAYVNGSPSVEGNPPPTPNIDALAASGVRFTSCWGSPVCSPMRVCVVAFNAPHTPFHLPPADLITVTPDGTPASNPDGHYRAMIEAMDTEIGRLFRETRGGLDALLQDTRVIFVADNGTPPAAADPPLERSAASREPASRVGSRCRSSSRDRMWRRPDACAPTSCLWSTCSRRSAT